ncbi:MAG: hypothetical protein IKH45_05990 [Neisseriaceae bacterium]|nr:hypothetical protein [Neisseriaceae bacterium]
MEYISGCLKKDVVIASRYGITAWQSPCRLGRLKRSGNLKLQSTTKKGANAP